MSEKKMEKRERERERELEINQLYGHLVVCMNQCVWSNK